MVEVKALCAMCLSRRVIRPTCYPGYSAQALARELRDGWLAHCECHHRFVKWVDA